VRYRLDLEGVPGPPISDDYLCEAADQALRARAPRSNAETQPSKRLKSPSSLEFLLAKAKRLAKEYYRLTGRPLGITGEVAEYEAARLLALRIAEVRQPGYDAWRLKGRRRERIQVKGRVILPDAKPGQRIGRIDITKKWDTVILVLLDENYDATEILEAGRRAITRALTAPGSRSRNERGALGVAKFRSIGRRVWPPPSGRRGV